MKLYAERPVRACLQLLSDLLALAWAVLWISTALSLREAVSRLDRPGELLASAGAGVSEHMATAAEAAERVPLAGDALAAPFASVGGAGESLTSAGTSFQASVADLALYLPLVTAVIPLALLAATWLPARVRWMRQATAVRSMRAMSPEAGSRLLALRALTSVSPTRLMGVHEDPVGAWHADDPEATRVLAALELRRLGLRST
ncbi:hypothetical protein DFP74_0716 [Nocardiopsis sp. Huas11]|uniref:hypothetical protein n=1 Tax=Nocardiopsis sp. Huas11 TaxID=2183912 RepID=UPI000EB5AD9A|nr:hypothetical protein [Nocardiopsis sp. Huas11]RKS05125.1 hypothetical protein DFP74_0716 [Nocardiopsis sp. Huas11]